MQRLCCTVGCGTRSCGLFGSRGDAGGAGAGCVAVPCPAFFPRASCGGQQGVPERAAWRLLLVPRWERSALVERLKGHGCGGGSGSSRNPSLCLTALFLAAAVRWFQWENEHARNSTEAGNGDARDAAAVMHCGKQQVMFRLEYRIRIYNALDGRSRCAMVLLCGLQLLPQRSSSHLSLPEISADNSL